MSKSLHSHSDRSRSYLPGERRSITILYRVQKAERRERGRCLPSPENQRVSAVASWRAEERIYFTVDDSSGSFQIAIDDWDKDRPKFTSLQGLYRILRVRLFWKMHPAAK